MTAIHTADHDGTQMAGAETRGGPRRLTAPPLRPRERGWHMLYRCPSRIEAVIGQVRQRDAKVLRGAPYAGALVRPAFAPDEIVEMPEWLSGDDLTGFIHPAEFAGLRGTGESGGQIDAAGRCIPP
ncbi:hypothetical protein [Roseovarius salis]|uniref:hypothetical protein n=1 Tax=Roseovarius salis TaxID=3376063 RepID=UPI0037CAC58B